MKKLSMALSSVLLLSACFGSDDLTRAEALAEVADDTFNAFSAIEEAEGPTDYAAVGLETGSVNYEGFALFSSGTIDGGGQTVEYIALGTFEATADFGAAQSVTGTASGFIEGANPGVANEAGALASDLESAGSVVGSFAFDLSILSRGGNAAADGTMTGSLTATDGTEYAFTDQPALGDFYGDDLDALVVNSGELTTDAFTVLNVTGLR